MLHTLVGNSIFSNKSIDSFLPWSRKRSLWKIVNIFIWKSAVSPVVSFWLYQTPFYQFPNKRTCKYRHQLYYWCSLLAVSQMHLILKNHFKKCMVKIICNHHKTSPWLLLKPAVASTICLNIMFPLVKRGENRWSALLLHIDP